ncbi:MAG: IS200/IS605 family accessory protein TnpB-related protein [Candidatus Nitrosocaldus sp.]
MKRPRFYGREVRGIRRHYNWLRLGERRLLNVIRKIGSKEKGRVDAILHKISRAIVDEAKELRAIIIIGDLKGIKDRAKGKGKRMNRIVSNMPYHSLT